MGTTDTPAEPGKKIAIVGFAQTNRDQAPFNDPSWEIWTMNDAWSWIPRATRWFELHSDYIYEWELRRPARHLEFLKEFQGPVYLLEARADMPNSVRFPIEQAIQTIGYPYLTSSVAYMLALAIMERPAEIGIWGIELATRSEYEEQRPCVEYLMGLAAGRGIPVYLPDNCLLRSGPMYGRGSANPAGEKHTPSQFGARLKALQTRKAELLAQHEKRLTLLDQLRGATGESRYWIQQRQGQDEGITARFFERVGLLEKREGELNNEIAILAGQVAQMDGALLETQYWIGQTPEGADPKIIASKLDGVSLALA